MNNQGGTDEFSSAGKSLDIESTRRYYKYRLRYSQRKNSLPSYVWPEYSSVIRTIERFSLMTHLIFLYKRRKISKKEYIELSLLWNAAILEQLRRKRLLSELDN